MNVGVYSLLLLLLLLDRKQRVGDADVIWESDTSLWRVVLILIGREQELTFAVIDLHTGSCCCLFEERHSETHKALVADQCAVVQIGKQMARVSIVNEKLVDE